VEEDPIRFMRDRVSSHLCGMFPRDDLVSLILKPNISEKIDPSFYAIPSLEQNTWYVTMEQNTWYVTREDPVLA
jgi:hypothetical protein